MKVLMVVWFSGAQTALSVGEPIPLLTVARILLMKVVSLRHLHPTTLMPTPIPPTSVPAARRSAIKSAASWLSLVAATTAGLGPSSTLRTRVTADVADDLDGLRLVVHSYLPGQLGESLVPSAAEKPVASSQRAVTAAELRRGVIVDMVQPSHGSGSTTRPVVLAWLERGRPDLDYDARLARPVPGVLKGCAKTRGSSVELSASVMLAAS